MKNINKKIENGNVVITLNVSGEAWTSVLADAKKSLIENLEIKGFRKGKVPAEIAEKHVSQGRVNAEATDKVLNKYYSEAMKEMEGEKIVSQPEVNLVKVSDSEVELTLTSALFPEIKLGKTSGFSAKQESVEVTSEEVEQEMKQVEAMLNETVDSDNDTVKDGDIVNIDFLGKKDGVAFDGGEAKGFDLTIGSKQFIEGFEEKLIGAKVGEEKVLDLKFPEAYPQEDLAGKDVTFDVKVNSIKITKKLEGEDLENKLKTMGFESEADMKVKIETIIKERKEQSAADTFFRAVIDEIIEADGTEIDIPASMIQKEVEGQIKQFEAQLQQSGMDLKAYLKMLNKSKEEFIEEQIKSKAEEQIKTGLIYSELIEKFDIKVEESDVNAEFEKIAKAQNMDIEEVKKFVQPQQIENNLTFLKLIEKLA